MRTKLCQYKIKVEEKKFFNVTNVIQIKNLIKSVFCTNYFLGYFLYSSINLLTEISNYYKQN